MVLIDPKKKQRNMIKTEYFFDFERLMENDDLSKSIPLEQGLPTSEISELYQYLKTKSAKDMRKRRRSMKYIRVKNLFTTSKCYMLFQFM